MPITNAISLVGPIEIDRKRKLLLKQLSASSTIFFHIKRTNSRQISAGIEGHSYLSDAYATPKTSKHL